MRVGQAAVAPTVAAQAWFSCAMVLFLFGMPSASPQVARRLQHVQEWRQGPGGDAHQRDAGAALAEDVQPILSMHATEV